MSWMSKHGGKSRKQFHWQLHKDGCIGWATDGQSNHQDSLLMNMSEWMLLPIIKMFSFLQW
jgi:hypothetical protein